MRYSSQGNEKPEIDEREDTAGRESNPVHAQRQRDDCLYENQEKVELD